VAATMASVALIVRLIQTDPLSLVFPGLRVLIAVFGCPLLLYREKTAVARAGSYIAIAAQRGIDKALHSVRCTRLLQCVPWPSAPGSNRTRSPWFPLVSTAKDWGRRRES